MVLRLWDVMGDWTVSNSDSSSVTAGAAAAEQLTAVTVDEAEDGIGSGREVEYCVGVGLFKVEVELDHNGGDGILSPALLGGSIVLVGDEDTDADAEVEVEVESGKATLDIVGVGVGVVADAKTSVSGAPGGEEV